MTSICSNYEFHILLIELALLTVSSFMHLYFLLKAMIMILTVAIYVFYSYYSNLYEIIADQYHLSSHLFLIQISLEVVFFILLLIGLDRRVRRRRATTEKETHSSFLDRIHEPIGSALDGQISK